MRFDITNNILQVETIRPQKATGAVNGQEIDLQGCQAIAFAVSVGGITGSSGDASVTLEEADTSGGSFSAVADADLIGSEPEALAANTTYRFGYKGSKQFVRAVFDNGGETDVEVCCIGIKGHLAQEPEGQTFSS